MSGNHTIAVVKGKQDYNTLKESLANVINDVNSLIEDGVMTVDGVTVRLDVFLGGDYKVNISSKVSFAVFSR